MSARDPRKSPAGSCPRLGGMDTARRWSWRPPKRMGEREFVWPAESCRTAK